VSHLIEGITGMRPLSEREIRSSFINCTQGEAKRLHTPRGLADIAWPELNFLGWRDLSAMTRNYLVAEQGDGLIGVAFRQATHKRHFLQRNMCSLCFTTHPGSGVALVSARKAAKAGRRGDSVGLYMCTDMSCSLYARGKKVSGAMEPLEETLSVDEKVARLAVNLAEFLAKVIG
jgi:hypothetical protein